MRLGASEWPKGAWPKAVAVPRYAIDLDWDGKAQVSKSSTVSAIWVDMGTPKSATKEPTVIRALLLETVMTMPMPMPSSKAVEVGLQCAPTI
jgi:hypothetical protein